MTASGIANSGYKTGQGQILRVKKALLLYYDFCPITHSQQMRYICNNGD